MMKDKKTHASETSPTARLRRASDESLKAPLPRVTQRLEAIFADSEALGDQLGFGEEIRKRIERVRLWVTTGVALNAAVDAFELGRGVLALVVRQERQRTGRKGGRPRRPPDKKIEPESIKRRDKRAAGASA